MNFIKYIGFKNIFLALVEKEKKFYAFVMKTDKIKLDAEQKTETAYGLYFTPVGQFTTEIKCNVIIIKCLYLLILYDIMKIFFSLKYISFFF